MAEWQGWLAGVRACNQGKPFDDTKGETWKQGWRYAWQAAEHRRHIPGNLDEQRTK